MAAGFAALLLSSRRGWCFSFTNRTIKADTYNRTQLNTAKRPETLQSVFKFNNKQLCQHFTGLHAGKIDDTIITGLFKGQ